MHVRCGEHLVAAALSRGCDAAWPGSPRSCCGPGAPSRLAKRAGLLRRSRAAVPDQLTAGLLPPIHGHGGTYPWAKPRSAKRSSSTSSTRRSRSSSASWTPSRRSPLPIPSRAPGRRSSRPWRPTRSTCSELRTLGKAHGATGEVEDVAGGLKELMESTLETATSEGADSDFYEAHAVLLNLKRKQWDSGRRDAGHRPRPEGHQAARRREGLPGRSRRRRAPRSPRSSRRTRCRSQERRHERVPEARPRNVHGAGPRA